MSRLHSEFAFYRLVSHFVKWTGKPIEDKVQSLIRRYYRIQNYLFVKRFSLDFDGYIPANNLKVDSDFSRANATAYQAYGTYYFKSLVRQAVSTNIQPEYFIDIGCGKGKQCFHARKYFNFEKIIGIDFSNELIDTAVRNLSNTKYSNIGFSVADAIDWHLPEKRCLIFLYNPFNEVILESFIVNNIANIEKYKSIICYANDVHRNILSNFGLEIIYRDADNNSIYTVK